MPDQKIKKYPGHERLVCAVWVIGIQAWEACQIGFQHFSQLACVESVGHGFAPAGTLMAPTPLSATGQQLMAELRLSLFDPEPPSNEKLESRHSLANMV